MFEFTAHSGTANAGHYTAFISPQADDQWFKFNDEIVTSCSPDEAIDRNYGNGTQRTNAYILVYINIESFSRILRDVSLDEVIPKDMIEAELSQEAEERFNQDQYFEAVVFTHETLEMCSQCKRGKCLFNRKCAMKNPFHIDKNKSFEDLIQLFVDSLGLASQSSFRLWTIDVEKDSIRLCDIRKQSDKLLKTLFKGEREHFFVELMSEEDAALFPFEKSKHVLIFIKHYDPANKKLSYFGHRCFGSSQRAQEIRAYIRDAIQFDGREEKIQLLYESGIDENYSHGLLQPNDIISKFAIKNIDTFFATVVFEILENGCKTSKFLKYFNSSSEKMTSHPIRSENVISVTIKRDTSTGEELLTQEFQSKLKLSEMIEQLMDAYVSI